MIRFAILLLAVLCWTSSIAAPIPSTGTVETFFSPRGGATEAIVREIGSARQEILVQAYHDRMPVILQPDSFILWLS